MSTTEITTIAGISIAHVGLDVTDDIPRDWAAALKARKADKSDVEAIRDIYKASRPPVRLERIASIVSAVYADTYWNKTFMDGKVLSGALQQAEGWDAGDCNTAAQAALRTWRGLLVRNTTQDQAGIPRQGTLTESPDVVCNGSAPVNHDLLLRRWGSVFFNVIDGLKNYCGARAQSVNFLLPTEKPQVRMFSTAAGLNPPPASWQVLNTDDGDDPVYSPMMGYVDEPAHPVQPGERVASKDSFFFEPLANTHHCLLAVVSTEFFTNDPTQVTGSWDTAQWLRNNGAVGWRNVNPQRMKDTALRFYNADAAPERFAIEAHCSHLPAGTRVSLLSADQAVGVATAAVEVTRGYQRIDAGTVTLPGDFAGDLVVRVETADGALLPPEAAIDVRMYQVLDVGHAHYGDAVEELGAHREAAEGAELRVYVGNYTLIGAPRE
jgi:hypothetical protein